jgi:hypothetical protein
VTQVVDAGALAAPAGFSATAAGTSAVQLQWLAVSGATSYEVHRSSSVTGTFVLAATTSSLAAADGLSIAANTTYLYKVRALGSSGASAFSAVDAATTTAFEDTGLAGVPIRANHIVQLRTAVNAMRAAANQSGMTFTDASLSGAAIKAIHITQLRSALNEARAAIGLPSISYVDGAIVPNATTVKADHILQLRTGTQ